MFQIGDKVIWQNPEYDLDLTVEQLIEKRGMQNAGEVVAVYPDDCSVFFPMLDYGRGSTYTYSNRMLRLMNPIFKDPDWIL